MQMRKAIIILVLELNSQKLFPEEIDDLQLKHIIFPLLSYLLIYQFFSLIYKLHMRILDIIFKFF